MTNSGNEKDNPSRRGDKCILRIPQCGCEGADNKPARHSENCSYLWLMEPRRRPAKNWRKGDCHN